MTWREKLEEQKSSTEEVVLDFMREALYPLMKECADKHEKTGINPQTSGGITKDNLCIEIKYKNNYFKVKHQQDLLIVVEENFITFGKHGPSTTYSLEREDPTAEEQIKEDLDKFILKYISISDYP